ncbi:MAG: hypothetical protein HRU09_07360 [Oligoflexales bacterium]|nr:hypothetical protein [Oligoflexales bacterium]
MQKTNRYALRSFCLFLGIFFLVGPAFANDSMSDHLDTKLLEKEKGSNALFLNKNSKNQKKSKGKLSRTAKNGNSQIFGSLKPMKDLKKLDEEINKLNSNLKILTAKIKKKQQEIAHEMNIDNLVAFEVALAKSDIANIQQIEMKIDGTSIYKSENFSGLWMPKDSLPVYYGSLNPGKHRIDVMARIVLLNPSDIPLNESLYRMINQSFTISVPIGSFKRKWVFTIYPPKNLNEPVKAQMFEGNFSS